MEERRRMPARSLCEGCPARANCSAARERPARTASMSTCLMLVCPSSARTSVQLCARACQRARATRVTNSYTFSTFIIVLHSVFLYFFQCSCGILTQTGNAVTPAEPVLLFFFKFCGTKLATSWALANFSLFAKKKFQKKICKHGPHGHFFFLFFGKNQKKFMEKNPKKIFIGKKPNFFFEKTPKKNFQKKNLQKKNRRGAVFLFRWRGASVLKIWEAETCQGNAGCVQGLTLNEIGIELHRRVGYLLVKL